MEKKAFGLASLSSNKNWKYIFKILISFTLKMFLFLGCNISYVNLAILKYFYLKMWILFSVYNWDLHLFKVIDELIDFWKVY